MMLHNVVVHMNTKSVAVRWTEYSARIQHPDPWVRYVHAAKIIGLTIPRRAIEVMHAVNSDVDGYQKAKSDPEAGDGDETVVQAQLKVGLLLCAFPSVAMAGFPETKDSDCVQ